MPIERWCSSDAWEDEGLTVRKEQKSKLRSPNGTPLFSEDQTEDFDALDDFGVFDDIPH